MLIKLNKVVQQAHPDVNHPGWGGGMDARFILKDMIVEEVFVSASDVIFVEPTKIRVGWDVDAMPNPCRSVSSDQPWWNIQEGSAVYIAEVGKMVALENLLEVKWLVDDALKGS